MHDAPTTPRLQITPGLRRFLDYPKFAGPTRLLILDTGYFFDTSWREAAESLGWVAASVPSVMVGGVGRDALQALFTTLGEFKPDFILASNYAGIDAEALFPRFFEDIRLPYVSWFTDTPRMIMWGRKRYVPDCLVAATWERAYIPHFERLGFKHIHPMPLATDPRRFDASPLESPPRPLAFVGHSMIAHASEAIEKFAGRPDVIDAARKAFDAGLVTRERFIEGLGAMFDPGLLGTLDAVDLRNLELLVNYEATKEQRIALVQALAPLGIEVRGDADWLRVHGRVGGQVGYFDDLPCFYRETAVNVNQTSLQMRWTVNQRVFDCPAAGGFLITDRQRDLEDLFDPDAEVVSYASLDELRDLAARYLAEPAARRRVVEAAQRRIRAHHTHAHRLAALDVYLRERFA